MTKGSSLAKALQKFLNAEVRYLETEHRLEDAREFLEMLYKQGDGTPEQRKEVALILGVDQ